jgi:PKD repeat protein
MAAGFSSNVSSGVVPLTVAFTDTSANSSEITGRQWDFNDGSTSTDRNPVHTFTSAGTYPVTLTVMNACGDSDLVSQTVTVHSIFENVFVYGNTVSFDGNTIIGPGTTVIITGGLVTSNLNGGSSIVVTTIYIDGDVNLNTGSASLGSEAEPGNIYIDGDLTLWSGVRDIWGDVYVNGDFALKDARIHGNVYVNGNLQLGWTPTLADNSRIYYTGTITHPPYYNSDILNKCIKQSTVPVCAMPTEGIPSTRTADWYTARGYVSGGTLAHNLKIFADGYSSVGVKNTATNVIIIANSGDITITGMGSAGVTGIFFAPNGKVTFEGGFLEGVVIARNGFFVTSGGITITFRKLSQYIGDPNDYPFDTGG